MKKTGHVEVKEGAMITRKIPEELRRKFKVRCAEEGISQQDKVIELMKGFAEKK